MQSPRGSNSAESDDRRAVLKVTVEVSENSSDTILVHEGDAAEDPKQFCSKHGLQADLIGPLTAYILENLRKSQVHSGRGAVARGGSASASAASRPQRGSQAEANPDKQVQQNEATSQLQTPSATPALGSRASLSSRGSRSKGGSPTPSAPRALRGTPRRETWGTTSRKSSMSDASVLIEVTGASQNVPEPMDVQDRFERLHKDAEHRRSRLSHLRHQVERDIEDQQARVTTNPSNGTIRNSASNRVSDELCLGDRLYRDAAVRQEKMKHLQIKHAELREQETMKEATFSPAIQASQRFCQGIGRAKRDPEGLKTKKKIESMKEMKERCALDGCTFKPEIDRKSELLMMQRLARMKITGPLHDALYEDALRRQERQVDAARILPPGVTFQPDIGVDHFRPPNDDNKEDFVARLAYSKNCADRQSECALSQDSRSQQAEFHPQTGRGPLTERNKDRLPIGEFLYESAREKALQAKHQPEEEAKAAAPSEASKQMLEQSKVRVYRDIFEALCGGNPDTKLSAETVNLESAGLSEEMANFLTPIVAYLQDTGAVMEFETFSSALDYQRQHSAVPTAHLFVLRRSTRSPRSTEKDGCAPQIDPRSDRIASRHRPRSATPLCEQLFREKEVWEIKRLEQKNLQEMRQLAECTFHPNSRARSMGCGSGRAAVRSPRSPRDGSTETPPDSKCNTDVGMDFHPKVLSFCSSTPRTNAGPCPTAALTSVLSHINNKTPRTLGVVEARQPETMHIDLTLSPCRQEIDQAEEAVARCKQVVASSQALPHYQQSAMACM